MGKIITISIGHDDYVNASSEKLLRLAHSALLDNKIINSDSYRLVTNSHDALLQARTALNGEYVAAIVFLATWVECPVVMTVLKELSDFPVIVWGVPIDETEKINTGSYVSAAMVSGTIKRLGLKCRCVIGSYNNKSTLDELKSFTKAAKAARSLRYCNVGLIGYTSMGIYPGTFDHVLMRYIVGPEVTHKDAYSLISRAEKASVVQVDRAESKLRNYANVSNDVGSDILKRTLALYVALKDMCENEEWSAVNIKCQYEFSKEYKVVPCVALSLLAEDGIVTSCEGDILNTISMLMLHLITDNVVTYADVLSHNHNTVKFSACGFLPFSMGQGKRNVQKFLEHPGFCGIQTSFVMKPGMVTFLRLIEDIGGYHLLCGTGTGLDTQLRDGCMPALDVLLDADINTLTKNYSGQHFALCYGDVTRELEELAIILGIGFLKIK